MSCSLPGPSASQTKNQMVSLWQGSCCHTRTALLRLGGIMKTVVRIAAIVCALAALSTAGCSGAGGTVSGNIATGSGGAANRNGTTGSAGSTGSAGTTGPAGSAGATGTTGTGGSAAGSTSIPGSTTAI